MARQTDRDDGAPAWNTSITEIDPLGADLLYRGLSLRELTERATFADTWSLLTTDALGYELPPAEPFPLRYFTGDARADLQSALAQLGPIWALRPLFDIDEAQALDDLGRASVMTLSLTATAARGESQREVSQREIDLAGTVTQRFLTRWRGEADPAKVRALDVFWIVAADHGLAPSTVAARYIAGTGADVATSMSAAVAAISGPRRGGASTRVSSVLDAVMTDGAAEPIVRSILSLGERLMGIGHPVYRGIDPRAEILRALCRELGAELYEPCLAYERAALAALAEHKPGQTFAPNLELWSVVVLDHLGVPPDLFASVFACGRVAGWSAHILEQSRTGAAPRPRAIWTGHGPRGFDDLR